MRISQRNAMQPRHTPANASSDAAPTSMTSTTVATVGAPAMVATRTTAEQRRPMPWANRLGGPGTSRGSMRVRRGRTTRVTSRPSGEKRGP